VQEGDSPDDTERSEKWLAWLSAEPIDRYWQKRQEAVKQGYLRNAAKVATAESEGQKTEKPPVTCVYTYDDEDTVEVMRLRSALRDMGVRRQTI